MNFPRGGFFPPDLTIGANLALACDHGTLLAKLSSPHDIYWHINACGREFWARR